MTLFVVAGPVGAEVAAWASASSLTPDLHRLVVHPAGPGNTAPSADRAG